MTAPSRTIHRNLIVDENGNPLNLAPGLVPDNFDYIVLTYVGASTRVGTVIYKLGGAGGTTIATLTLGYDGSNRLTSVTKT